MPGSYPLKDRQPPNARDVKRRRSRGIVSYREPEPSFWRRISRLLFSAPVFVPAVFAATMAIGILVYYWTVFSARIDTLLKGEVFTRSAGIYAAPRQLRVGENLSTNDLITYLRRAGYVEKQQQADTVRGRYVLEG